MLHAPRLPAPPTSEGLSMPTRPTRDRWAFAVASHSLMKGAHGPSSAPLISARIERTVIRNCITYSCRRARLQSGDTPTHSHTHQKDVPPTSNISLTSPGPVHADDVNIHVHTGSVFRIRISVGPPPPTLGSSPLRTVERRKGKCHEVSRGATRRALPAYGALQALPTVEIDVGQRVSAGRCRRVDGPGQGTGRRSRDDRRRIRTSPSSCRFPFARKRRGAEGRPRVRDKGRVRRC
ncbi:hypothetical protein PYCCODRAFT_606685 [Trametes coccinea BRFM310]|uniref:Uncharacterized protein n=1 Tax=Trametes coccinea (strain BRFM310) TaxID=1353009 RepID=A0A1Y2J3C6_TRAC3|nr:hypothetical protein PYCCODRAFT_606685 [Trametes coccinea BRFM310]